MKKHSDGRSQPGDIVLVDVMIGYFAKERPDINPQPGHTAILRDQQVDPRREDHEIGAVLLLSPAGSFHCYEKRTHVNRSIMVDTEYRTGIQRWKAQRINRTDIEGETQLVAYRVFE